ncbi:type II toxin-antitoxin system RelE family toxin [Leptolyngbya sp. PCC 6406]|uniref:type II toxin-antitoxin system RelE family toxin n=1 Tax=Leptolyngbya sp. PCC 6406 TaxID=1173264 RepID=UPI0002ABF4FE|nr:type II toxin-antitoxin system RelE/ParE family toxin [Leptolyngbya sp. PCC 6406]
MTNVRFTSSFKRRLKGLKKRYRQVQADLQPIIRELEQGHLIGDQVSGATSTVFKVRAKNSDIPTGKSGGYRIIYQVLSPENILLLLVYAKSDQADVSMGEIETAIAKALEE